MNDYYIVSSEDKLRHGMSRSEVAEILGITKAEVKAIEDAAIRKLRRRVESGKLDYLRKWLED